MLRIGYEWLEALASALIWLSGLVVGLVLITLWTYYLQVYDDSPLTASMFFVFIASVGTFVIAVLLIAKRRFEQKRLQVIEQELLALQRSLLDRSDEPW